MTPQELQGQRVLVVGFGVSGQSVARYLERCNVRFDVADERGAEASMLPATSRVHASMSVASDYDVIVLSPGIPRAHPEIVAALQSGVLVIGDVELFASVVSTPVVAVTGSNGKSTVVTWLTHALQSTGVEALACGNIGRGVLDALELTASVYVVELSSYQLESVTRLKPVAAVVLNVSDDHLDRYASMDAYAGVKRHVYSGAQRRVFNALDARTTPPGQARSTDLQINASANPVQGQAVCWHFALNESQAVTPAANETLLCRNEEPVLEAASLSVPGQHNAANALAVLALAECIDAETDITVDRSALLQGLAAWTGLPHRTALIGEREGVRWYDDSKGTNVDACIKAIEAMPGPVVLIAGGIGKGADFTPLRPVVADRVKQLILIGQDRAVLQQALQGSAPLELSDTLEDAVCLARAIAVSGDVVLLSPACSSFDMFDNYMARGHAFADAVTSCPEVQAS